jgi:hypothetical protein
VEGAAVEEAGRLMLPQRIPKPQKRASRWRSQAHCNFVRGFACAMCGSRTNTVPAHYRLGSGAGAGQRPDDWRTTPLCEGPHANADGQLGCHNRQHVIGERTFWQQYEALHGQTVDQLLAELIQASPKRAEIQRIQRERENV